MFGSPPLPLPGGDAKGTSGQDSETDLTHLSSCWGFQAMAAANPAKMLQDELTCSICLEYFKDPVSLDCDHNFCRACITQCWEGFASDISCPQCRVTFPQRNLRLNRQLRNVVEAVRELRLSSGREPEPERLCEKHKEPLKLFCKEDEIPICLVCDRSKEHRDHTVIPAEEAAEEFKEKIQAHLKMLREEREKLLGFKVTGEKRSQEYLRNTQTERQKIVSEFHQLRQFLEEQERLLLAQLEKLDKEIVKIQNENVSQVSEEISRLSNLISEMEGKYQKPVTELLQDVRSTFSRSAKGKFQQPEEISPKLELRLSDFSQKTVALMETLRNFKATLPSALETKRGGSLGTFRQCLDLLLYSDHGYTTSLPSRCAVKCGLLVSSALSNELPSHGHSQGKAAKRSNSC